MLWFAQNSLPLRWQRQRVNVVNVRSACCDLLKIHYLCGDKDNPWAYKSLSSKVVICSKFITFAVTKTTLRRDLLCERKLWFAQNSLPLRWQRQRYVSEPWQGIGCDLLKIHYLCGDKDNSCSDWKATSSVVICSKFITFAVTKTTGALPVNHRGRLWFAQNSLPLRWQRQLTVHLLQ